MSDKIILPAMHIIELKKMIAEGSLIPICYFCRDDDALLSVERISCIFKRDGTICFACHSHYIDALELQNNRPVEKHD